jgi:hypothetical protein
MQTLRILFLCKNKFFLYKFKKIKKKFFYQTLKSINLLLIDFYSLLVLS